MCLRDSLWQLVTCLRPPCHRTRAYYPSHRTRRFNLYLGVGIGLSPSHRYSSASFEGCMLRAALVTAPLRLFTSSRHGCLRAIFGRAGHVNSSGLHAPTPPPGHAVKERPQTLRCYRYRFQFGSHSSWKSDWRQQCRPFLFHYTQLDLALILYMLITPVGICTWGGRHFCRMHALT